MGGAKGRDFARLVSEKRLGRGDEELKRGVAKARLPVWTLGQDTWETEVWIAQDPDHMIRFNGQRSLGPY